MSSRFVPLECSLDDFIQKQSNKNTLSKTTRDLALFQEFLKAKQVDKNVETIEPSELNELVSAFIVEVKKKDGQDYEPTTLRSFISSFDRYLRKKDYPTTIMEGHEFRKARDILVAKQKELKKEGKGNKPNAARNLTDEEVDILFSKNLLGCSTPEALINTLWLNNTQYFGLRGCKEHRDMKWGDIKLQISADGTEYLEYNERQTKTRTGAEPKDTRKVKPKMFAVAGSDRNPVQFYHIYASKRPAGFLSDDSPFYLSINQANPKSSKPWFKTAPMGVNKLNSLMKTMAEKAQLKTSNLTNHSARKRMIQKLNDEEVPPTHIMQISGHKNVQSLNNYSSLSENQQRRISGILSNSSLESPVEVNSEVRCSTSTLSNQQPLGLFSGANIHSGTFNIAINTVNQSPDFSSFQTTKRRRYVIESDSD